MRGTALERMERKLRKFLIKAFVLFLVLIGGILVFGQFTNKDNEDMTKDMAGATYPVLSFYMGDIQINELFGYKDEMQAIYMRDTITPIDSDRILPARIQTYGNSIAGISYEIRSLDMQRLVAQTAVTEFDTSDDIVDVSFQIENILEDNAEYLLFITLETSAGPLHYYTRLVQDVSQYSQECIAFAEQFHNNTFDTSQGSWLATYMEPNSSGDNSNLAAVNIHSSLKQVQWADFPGERQTTPVPSIKEVNDTYTVVVMNYLMYSDGNSGEPEYYNVSEKYRIRYTSERIYLLDFEREMNQIFRSGNDNTYDNYLQLGIRDAQVEYATNEKGTIAAFIQEGELWEFNETNNQLSQVFSFNSSEGIDRRENNQQHDIRIINVDETGSTNFVVYGYMNSGSHEGRVGISVYHYDSVANTIEEELFIPSTQSFQVMKETIDQLMYENTQGIFFLLLEDTIYRIDLATMEASPLVEGIVEGQFAVSDSQQYFVWSDEISGEYGTSLNSINLDTEEINAIQGENGNYIKPLGFMNDDLIYGEAHQSDMPSGLTQGSVFPMYKIEIMELQSNTQVKEYEKSGYYISDVSVIDDTIYLNRLSYNGIAFVEAEQDTIMSRDSDDESSGSIHTTLTEERQTQVQISMTDFVKEAAPKLLTPKEVIFENVREVTLEGGTKMEAYIAYAWGNTLIITNRLQTAIAEANSQMGVVLDQEQKYVWMRSRGISKTAIPVQVGLEDTNSSSLAKCVSAMLENESVNIQVQTLLDQGQSPEEILTEALGDAIVLNLSGAALEEVLYYVNLGHPVLAVKNGTEAVLITGYTSSAITIFDPSTNAESTLPILEASDLFVSAGSIYISYLVP